MTSAPYRDLSRLLVRTFSDWSIGLSTFTRVHTWCLKLSNSATLNILSIMRILLRFEPARSTLSASLWYGALYPFHTDLSDQEPLLILCIASATLSNPSIQHSSYFCLISTIHLSCSFSLRFFSLIMFSTFDNWGLKMCYSCANCLLLAWCYYHTAYP